jgi:hypothetical protein
MGESMRVLFAPLNFGDVIQDGIYDAFIQLGCEFRVFDFMSKYLKTKNHNTIRDEFVREVRAFKPHLALFQIQHTSVIDGDTISRAKAEFPDMVTVNWTGDVRNYIPSTYKDVARACDFNLISSTGQLQMFESGIGKAIGYWQIGYNPKLYKPADYPVREFENDAVFIGNCDLNERYPGTNDRQNTCRLLRGAFGSRFKLYGTRWPQGLGSLGSVDQRTISSIYHKTCALVSVNHYNDLSHYFSDRLLMCMASGRPTISLKFPNIETYFTNMCDLVVVDSVDQIPDKVRMLKDNPELANFIGTSGAAKVRAEHTYFSRVKELFNIVGLT